MNINIQFDKSVTPKSSDEDYLRQCVIKVSSKIKMDVAQVVWVIYDYETLRLGQVERQINDIKRRIYGCRVDLAFWPLGTNEIWISTKILSQKVSVKGMGDSIYDVIVHEIAHLITKKDHEDPEYISLHRSLLKKFYD